jgi:PKD repeat protein
LIGVPLGSSATLVGADTSTPSFLADLPGTYAVSLIVTDGNGLSSAPDTAEVSSLNVSPVADGGPDAGAMVGDLVPLDGTGSSDADHDPLAYAWWITGAPEGSAATLIGASTATPTLVPDLAGQYSVQLVVNDCFQDSDPDYVTISVITAEEFAEYSTAEALNIVTGLPSASVTTQGNQTALGNFLTQAIAALQASDTEEAMNKLGKALDRTDGCVLRGEPDGAGPGRDWITDCAAQEAVYWLLRDALDAISP